MEWLNYHHLRYFYVTAREGGLKRAAEKLHVSQPSISEQIKELEASLGEPLFRRSGRSNVLTDAGQIVFRYAEEIFGLGAELLRAVKQRPGLQSLRFYVGVSDAIPKLVVNDILKPVLALPQTIHIICREGKLEDLLAQLAAHRLDIVLADEPASSSFKFRAFTQLLGESAIVFCAAPRLAARLRRGFPGSLHDAPALLPTENTALRRCLERWFQQRQIRPRVVAEFDDAALMKVMAADEKGFTPIPAVVADEAIHRYHLRKIGVSPECKEQFYAITAERRIIHPAAVAITRNVQNQMSPRNVK
ncbi:MAG TPA: LysR family transcriptional regulator [Candidatus Paceibacterota bacterium]|nr:LysR family transcriptional regulator [Verrucomicrobiota bacterium]HSA09369.1 LysR family transcriptional regulator [Candidatus Paceibacterota bacterium]